MASNFNMEEITDRWAFRSYSEDLSDEEKIIYSRTTQRLDADIQEAASMTELRMMMLESMNDLNLHLDDSDENNIKLFLHYQKLTEMPTVILNRFAHHIHYLDLNYNNLASLDFLAKFPNLLTLIADNNPITTYTILPYMPKITTAWFNNCKLTELYPFVSNLGASLPNLEFLSMMGNPCKPDFFNTGELQSYKEFRLYVISIFPKLKVLDDRPVFDFERRLSGMNHPNFSTVIRRLPRKRMWRRFTSFFKPKRFQNNII